jgi:iron(III) transport system permease protein
MRQAPPSRIIFHAALIAALILILGWPALATLIDAIRGAENPSGGLMARLEGGTEVRVWRMAGETLRLVAATELMALPIGIVLAFLLFRTDLIGRGFWLAALALAAPLPMPVLATAWLGGFGDIGRTQVLGLGPILVGRFAAAFVHAAAALPWIVWIVGLGLLAVEPELEESARLDMPPWRVAMTVTLRRSIGAIAGAALAVAVLTAGDMTVTDILSIRTYAEEAYLQFGLGRGPGAAAATALPPLAVVGGFVFLGAGWLLRSDPARLTSARAPNWKLGRWRIAASAGVALALLFLFSVPLYSLVRQAGRVGGNARLGVLPHWSIAGFGGTLYKAVAEVVGPSLRRPWRGPLGSSLIWGSLGAAVSVALAWPLAWACRKPGPWRFVAAFAAALALATPGPIAGMAMVLAYHRVAAFYDSPAVIVLTYAMRTWPYALLLLWPAVRTLPPEYFEAAELDGYTAPGQVARVALPLTLGAIGLAWAAAFVLSLGELSAAYLATPPGHTSLTFRIWDKLHIPPESSLAGFVLVTLGVFAIFGLVVAWGILRFAGQRRSS